VIAIQQLKVKINEVQQEVREYTERVQNITNINDDITSSMSKISNKENNLKTFDPEKELLKLRKTITDLKVIFIFIQNESKNLDVKISLFNSQIINGLLSNKTTKNINVEIAEDHFDEIL
jgi:uncharacterized coiled-coil DUF342 family protein